MTDPSADRIREWARALRSSGGFAFTPRHLLQRLAAVADPGTDDIRYVDSDVPDDPAGPVDGEVLVITDKLVIMCTFSGACLDQRQRQAQRDSATVVVQAFPLNSITSIQVAGDDEDWDGGHLEPLYPTLRSVTADFETTAIALPLSHRGRSTLPVAMSLLRRGLLGR